MSVLNLDLMENGPIGPLAPSLVVEEEFNIDAVNA